MDADRSTATEFQELEEFRASTMHPVLGHQPDAAQEPVVEMRSLGYYPEQSRATDSDTLLANKLKKAICALWLLHSRTVARVRLEAFRFSAMHPVDRAWSAQLFEEPEAPADPRDSFADVAQSRLDQISLSLLRPA